MKILKFIKNSSKTNLFFSLNRSFHVQYPTKTLIKRLPTSISFSIRNIRTKTEEFNLIFEKKNNSNIEETSIAEETLYEPKEKLVFVNELCKIYENDSFFSSRNSLTLLALVVGFLLYRFIKRLRVHFQNRKIFRSIFYIILIAGCALILRSLKTFAIIVKKIDLCQDGKHIILTHPKYLILLNRKKVDISAIQRPLKVDSSSLKWMEYGYPIVVENYFFTLARSGTIHNKELLPVILNGKYINTQSPTINI